jgi:CDP-glycerol glycerophosphotransferase
MRIFPIKEDKILLSSFMGRVYGDSPKAITERLALDKNYDLVWILKKEHNFNLPNGVRFVQPDSIQMYYELVTSKVWIDSHLKYQFEKKRKNQIYIQTYHGCIALKKVDADVVPPVSPGVLNRDKYNARIVDYYVSNSKKCSNMYKSALLYNGTILEYGCPRNDIFFGDNQYLKDAVLMKYNIPKGAKILLYAPTFRNNHSIKPYSLYYEKIANAFSEKRGGQWYILVKLHPMMMDKDNTIVLPRNVINVTDYGDAQELLYVSDALVTDYSSLMFDYMLTRRPIFLFSLDFDDYSKERGLYFEYKKLPFPLAFSNEELCSNIITFDDDIYQKSLCCFMNSLKIVDDGQASVRIIELLKKIL